MLKRIILVNCVKISDQFVKYLLKNYLIDLGVFNRVI